MVEVPKGVFLTRFHVKSLEKWGSGGKMFTGSARSGNGMCKIYILAFVGLVVGFSCDCTYICIDCSLQEGSWGLLQNHVYSG